ncbi:MAG: DUF3304 domain-containing protein [Zoogloeaceae bacterium]|nr:DUF3304 domain-containing protein [Zoogloeaceae bacterium]
MTALLALALCCMSGCDRSEPAVPESDMVPLQVSVLNYTDHRVNNVDVDGSWAGSMGPHGGGGKFAGSSAVPRQWRPDFTVTIRWQDDEQYADPVWRSGGPIRYHERILPVQPYQKAADGQMAFLWVAFFPNDVIKLYPTWVGPDHPDFPDGLIDPSLACARKFPGDKKCFSRPPSEWIMEQQEETRTESAQ